MRKLFILFLLFCFLCNQANAATTWYACTSGGNWNANVWTSVSADQGTCLAALGTPVAGDTAILNSSSGNISLTANAAAAVLNMTGYGSGTGTLAFSTFTLTITGGSTLEGVFSATTGSISQAGGLTLSGTPTGSTFPQINLTASQTLTSGGFTWPGNLALDGTDTFSGNWQNGGNFLLFNHATAVITGANIITAGLQVYNDSGANSISLTIPHLNTVTVTNNIYIVSNSPSTPTTILSDNGSIAAPLNYTGTLANEDIHGAVFTRVDASGSSVALNNWYGGTLTTTTNISNVTSANLGGGGGGCLYAC